MILRVVIFPFFSRKSHKYHKENTKQECKVQMKLKVKGLPKQVEIEQGLHGETNRGRISISESSGSLNLSEGKNTDQILGLQQDQVGALAAVGGPLMTKGGQTSH